jgi:glycosyltransferase involved in cell wall biosynthesis
MLLKWPNVKIRYLSVSKIPSTTANSIHVLKMAQALAQHGHTVELVCPRESNLPHLFSRRQNLAQAPEIAGQYGIDPRWAPSIDLLHLPAWKPLRMIDYALRAACLGLSSRFVFTRHALIGAFCALLRVPTYLELHSPHLGSVSRFFLARACKVATLRAVVVISTPLRELLLEAHPFPGLKEKILIEPDAVDLTRFESSLPRAEAKIELGFKASDAVLGYAGHLYAGRGIERILDVAETIPTIRVLIAGGTPTDIERVRGLLEERGIRNVSLLGFLENAKLPRVLAACDFLAMPYQRQVRISSGSLDTSAWMSPMKLFEYMAARRVILSSDLPVLREILNEENAVLLDPEDSSAWSRAVERLMKDRSTCAALEERAWLDVQHYDWKKRVARIVAPLDREAARALVFQRILPHYRVEIFRRLASELQAWVCHSKEVAGSSLHDVNPNDFPHIRLPRIYLFNKETAVAQSVLTPLLKYRPSAVVSEFALGYITLWFLFLLRPLLRFRLALWTHGVENKVAAGGSVRFENLRLKALASADHLIVYSERRAQLLRERLKNAGLPAPRMTVAPNSVPLGKFMSVSLTTQSTLKLAFVGRLLPGKGLKLALETFRALSPKMPLEFEIIGDGPLRAHLEQEKIPGVRFHGAIHAEEDLARLLGSCAVFLHPGAIGLSAFHALGAGLPIVTCAPTPEKGPYHGPEFDLLEHGNNAWICAESADALAQGVQSALADLTAARARARESVKALGSLDAMVEGFRQSITQIRAADIRSPGNL